MNWSEQIDIYCERLGPGFWAEPLNAISNLAFIAAALILWPRARRHRPSALLCAILFVIGVGSFLFHTFATQWASTADSTPIGIFILVYLYFVHRHFVGLPRWAAGLSTLGFAPYAALMVPLLNALPFFRISDFYWTVPILLFVYAAGLWRRDRATAEGMAIGAGILTLSITLRSLDMTLCYVWPFGTHVFWHLLNGVMLGWMIHVWLGWKGRRLAAAGASG
ncbi:ceramidase domain-containing protein [Pseudoroseicyclus sp. CXY001]|uniref:ceramidase domain-containing protein n=1 Tax=Pseudoroseicyclus sp. CXY001 TaxID=3242492 RepID=UPI003570D047